jgi:glycosyltransferase involved in cell wall biosynthesis/LmbE family N-acetylglucosaminyl deacetylase
MHICFNALDYPSELGGGGVGNQVQLLARALVAAGHRVTVLALAQQGLPDEADDHGVRIVRIRPGNWHWYLSRLPFVGPLLTLPVRELERSWAAWRRITQIHDDDPVDVIEGTETAMFFLPRRLAAVPYFVRLHGEPYTFVKHTPGTRPSLGLRLCRVLQRSPMRRCRQLVAPSFAHAREIAQELGATAPPIQVIPNVLAPGMFQASSTRPPQGEAPFGERARIVLYVGRLERGKGVLTLLEAARDVLEAAPNTHLVLAGARHPTLRQEDLDRLLATLRCRDRIHFLGHIPWPRLQEWYRRAAVCVLPSFYETFGLAALEPMALGVPVVVTAAGGLPEVVEDGRSGLVVPPGDVAALADSILRLLGDPALGSRIGVKARQRAATHFHLQAHWPANLALYGLAAGKATAHPRLHVFFSPHLDDAVFSCGGLIHALASHGEPVRAITVFAGLKNRLPLSAFARHLHAKWGLGAADADRLEEDHRAFQALGVREVEHWDYLEAPYRKDAAGEPLYCTYEGLKDRPALADLDLVEEVRQRIAGQLQAERDSARLYFPLGLGDHVDHQVLFRVGLLLRQQGWDVRFYEDWPYAERYAAARVMAGWFSEGHDVSVEAKLAATLEYRSQLSGLGPSERSIKERLTRYARRVGSGPLRERSWWLSSVQRTQADELEATNHFPFRVTRHQGAPGGLRQVLSILWRSELARLLPPGAGVCLDLGGTDAADRQCITGRGYLLVDLGKQAEAGAAPIDAPLTPPAGPASAVVAWKLDGKRSDPSGVVARAAEVLEPGGILVGRFPIDASRGQGEVAGAWQELLARHGFLDVEVIPGLLWRRQGLLGWVERHLGRVGWLVSLSCRGMKLLLAAGLRGLTRAAGRPGLAWELADHVAFVGRKRSGGARCTSAS